LSILNILGGSPPSIGREPKSENDVGLGSLENKEGSNPAQEVNSRPVDVKNPVHSLPVGIPSGIDVPGAKGEPIPDPVNQDGGGATQKQGRTVGDILSILNAPVNIDRALSIYKSGQVCPLVFVKLGIFERGGIFHHVGESNLPEDEIKWGLLWVGSKFYPSTSDFNTEAREMGISRRITMVPRGFRIGETWVALAHRKASVNLTSPNDFGEVGGIFHIFCPQRIEYVVKEFDPKDKLERLEKRGITLVRVIREQTEMKGVA
jgi:hypothetical protein